MSLRQPAAVRRAFVEVPAGTVHVAQAGESGPPLLLLHQTPRSWDEYRDVLPLLGERYRAVAMDTIGFGDSSRLPQAEDSIEAWARVALTVLDALGLEEACVVGHHTGAVVGVELASQAPERVRALVLSSVPVYTAEERARRLSGRAVVDDVDTSTDGSHVLELWRGRAAFYPADRIDLLERYLVDALKAGPLAAEGHRVAARYDTMAALGRVRCRVLLIGAPADPYAYPHLARAQALLPDAETVEIEGGMVPLPDQLPEQFAAAVSGFLGT
ncbi:MAG: alpha/beta hydrolase [Gaiella sp.]|nr:alpha/beta hydrolase [Gaiella sp.]